MRKTQLWIALGCCFFFAAQSALAQASRKPGLWEMTSTMTWQQSPMPAGMTMPPGAKSPFGGGPHTMQICLTQAQLDKYGAPTPQNGANGQCQLANVQKHANNMTADWICTGMMTGKGYVESSWSDSEHASTKIHFLGSMQMGPSATPVEYTIQASSVFKGSDCGSVKPMSIPDKDKDK